MENRLITERLAALRKAMAAQDMDYYLIPSSDYHNSEYVADFFHVRRYFSGFTGSTGTLIVGRKEAGLWTDGRYFVQAERELAGTGITLYRMLEPGVPTVSGFLAEKMPEGGVLGFDGMTLAAETGVELAQKLKSKNITIKYGTDLASEIWQDRPALPCTKVFILPEDIAGKSYAEKSAEVREKMREYGTGVLFLAKLDDICWLTNLRAADVACNPVMLSYLLLTTDHAYLFVQPDALDDTVREYCKANDITVMDYHKTVQHISGYAPVADVLFDRMNVSYSVFMVLRQITTSRGHTLVNRMNPTVMLKACKNETELAHTRETYLLDSALLTKYIYRVKQDAGRVPMTEYSAAKMLDGMRAAQEGFLDISFDTIAGYGENGAIVHYKPEEDSCAKVEAKGMLLVDSGGNYLKGTTDVTRTIVLGEVTDEMKKHFTLVCAGMLRLANARFVRGCTGRNVDAFARAPLWEHGLDYNHGTGHGVGFCLNVHEGPQNIRYRMTATAPEVALEEGMLVSDEPGVYIEGSHGVRTENILEVVKEGESAHGQFLGFRHLTYVPIDREAIDTRFFTPTDLEAFNAYHAAVYERIAPYIEEEEIKNWLKQVTSPV